MINVSYASECLELMSLIELRPEQIQTTLNDRHRGLVDPGFSRIVACHWISDEQIILVDSAVKKKDVDSELGRVTFEKVTANVAIELRPDLPNGKISREMSMEQLLEVVANSFGNPVTGHPDEKPRFL